MGYMLYCNEMVFLRLSIKLIFQLIQNCIVSKEVTKEAKLFT